MSKTKDNSDSARREYVRMREEQAINNRFGSATCFVYREDDESERKGKYTLVVNEVAKRQNAEPEVMSFPFVDNEAKSDNVKAEGNVAHSGYTHGAKLCMLSAIVHMKCMAHRKAKSNKERTNRVSTTLDANGNTHNAPTNSYSNDDVSNDVIDDDPWDHLRKCRYLRGKEQEKELTISEIFH